MSTMISFTAWLIEVRWLYPNGDPPQLAGVMFLVLPTGLPEEVRWQVGRLPATALKRTQLSWTSGV
jgi:hypothetical protein